VYTDAKDESECGGHLENDHGRLRASEEDWPKKGGVDYMRLDALIVI
jgi:hypothetical protein